MYIRIAESRGGRGRLPQLVPLIVGGIAGVRFGLLRSYPCAGKFAPADNALPQARTRLQLRADRQRSRWDSLSVPNTECPVASTLHQVSDQDGRPSATKS